MNKTDFVKAFAENANIPARQAKQFVDVFLQTAFEALSDNEDLEFNGFGAFRNVYVEDAVRRNPFNGEDIFVPAHYLLKFKPSAKLKQAVR